VRSDIVTRALAAAGALAATPGALAAQGGGSGIFSLDVGLAIWTWVLFLLTLGILAWKVFPMIAGGLEERRERIQGAIDEAREEREKARALLEEQKEELAEARREAREIIEEGREAGERLREEILEEARQQQEEMMKRARRELEQERQKLRDELRREAIEVSIAAAERLLRERLDEERDRELVHDYLSELA